MYSRNSGDGRTWYDSAQFKVERHFGDWILLASYVREKTLGMLTYRQIFSQNNVYAQDMTNLNDMKSYLPFDQPNMFNFLSTYSLPFGRGKKFLHSQSRVMDAIVGGWTISNAHQVRSGVLIQASCTNTLGNGVLFTRLKKCVETGVPILSGQDRTSLNPNNPASLWFNPASYAQAGQYQFGPSALYNTNFRQPVSFTDNIGLVKNLSVWPKGDGNLVRLQLRADAFNAFNRTAFGVNGAIGNPNFGRATGPQLGGRIITMGARVNF